MITIDNERLTQKLQETCLKYYSWQEPYFVVESIKIMFNDEDNSYMLDIEGRAGDEYKESLKEIRFSILIDPTWSYDFIQGYFQKALEEVE